MKKRVLLAGLAHESHSFLDGVTSLSDFQVRAGSRIFEAHGDGSPLDGVLSFGRARDWEVLPALDVRCLPGATAADEVLEHFWTQFRASAEACGSVDGVYLVLHGAMCCVSYPDVEGELLERIRRLPALKTVPLCGVLDLH